MFRKNFYGGMVLVVQDLPAGSSGKGSLSAWLADKYNINLATNNWMPNAGHYVELDNGTRILTQHIPSSFINPNAILYINSGASINLDILIKEINTLDSEYNIKHRLYIHPHANVITQENVEYEKSILKSGSTFKGCGASIASKSMRQAKLAKDYDVLNPYIKDMTSYINDLILKGGNILIEGSQGVDLDINHSEYPYTTSRQTIPAQLIADSGIAPHAITNIIANMRTYPIRINNQSAANSDETCYSGNYWGSPEITWETVAERAGYTYEEFIEKYKKSIMTSVTKKVRRVFEFPKNRFLYDHKLIGGNIKDTNGNNMVIYSVNFINFIDKNVDCVKTKYELITEKVIKWFRSNLGEVSNQVKFIRTGPKHSEIIESESGFNI